MLYMINYWNEPSHLRFVLLLITWIFFLFTIILFLLPLILPSPTSILKSKWFFLPHHHYYISVIYEPLLSYHGFDYLVHIVLLIIMLDSVKLDSLHIVNISTFILCSSKCTYKYNVYIHICKRDSLKNKFYVSFSWYTNINY